MCILMLVIFFGSTAFTVKKPVVIENICVEINGINLDFVLLNKTGYDISSIYVAPTTQKSWGEDIMGKELLKNGESVEIVFDANETIKKWDMYVTWDGYEADEDVHWIGFDLSVINEITLFYDASTGKTWAESK